MDGDCIRLNLPTHPLKILTLTFFFVCVFLCLVGARNRSLQRRITWSKTHLEEEALSHRGGAKHQQNALRGGGGEGV